MDSITQASLGALCGEMVLGRQLGYKGALWGLLFGTLPDLDIIAYQFLTASEQLMWHRGISHSILLMFVGSFIFGLVLEKIHRSRKVNYWRYFVFVFLTLSTHVLIDCFNTYGTQIMEPFNSERFSIGNIAIIDIFFLGPLLLGLFLAVIVFRKKNNLRSHIGWITTLWLCIYFAASLFMKHIAKNHFEEMMAKKGIETDELMTAPTISNIFLWRMVARDKDGYYVSYWSLFDQDDREPDISNFSHGHELEKGFEESEDLKILKWFCQGWYKIYKSPNEPDSIYIAAVQMGEVHTTSQLTSSAPEEKDLLIFNELRPVFIWKLTKSDDGKNYELERPFKMTRDGFSILWAGIKKTYRRVKGDESNWMKGVWSWDIQNIANTQDIIVEPKKEQ